MTVGAVAFVQDDDGVFDMLVNEVRPEVGFDHCSPSATFIWAFNLSACLGERNMVFTCNFVSWGLHGIPTTILNML